MSASPSPSRLLAFPGELRNRIYRMVRYLYMFVPPSTDSRYQVLVQDIVEVWRDGYERPPLINTCKAVRNETLKLYYEENTFCFYLENFEATTLFNFGQILEAILTYLQKVNGTEDIAVTRRTMFPLGRNKNWPNLLKLLRHVHAGEVRLGVKPLMDREEDELQSQDVRDVMILGMLVMVKTLQKEAWEVVEKVMMDQKALLRTMGTNWIE